VHVEDHPLDYAGFEGEIPAGQYGAGSVEIFDRGTYELVEEKRDGGLTFDLHGQRLRGRWTLVPARLDGKDENWLLLRKDDGPKRRAWAPMLATAATAPPRGDGWVFEPKWDGYRAIATVRAGEARLTSRGGNDLGDRFPSLVRALPLAVRTPDAVLDVEVCSLDDRGRSRFEWLQRGEGSPVAVVFDLLEVAGTGSVRYVDWPAEQKAIDIGSFYADSAKFRAATGWQPRVPLREGLARSVAYYRAHLSHYVDPGDGGPAAS